MLPTRKRLLFQSNSFCSKVFAGRLAEVIWGALYSLRAPLSTFAVVRQVTVSVVPAAAALPWAPALTSPWMVDRPLSTATLD